MHRNRIPKFFFIQDYFINKFYAEKLNPRLVVEVLTGRETNDSIIESENKGCSLHVRLTDYKYIDKNPLGAAFYKEALELLGVKSHEPINVFTDDIIEAKTLVNSLGSYRFVFPEEEQSLNSEDLLLRLSASESLIASRSSLCWWACFVSSKKRPDTKIVCSWPDELILSNWVSLIRIS